MRTFEYQRTTMLSIAVQAIFAVLCGLALSWLAIKVPMPVLFAAFVAAGFCIMFLQRPDLGLLVILAVRPSTDVLMVLAGVGGAALRSPNVVLLLALIGCGGVYILGRRVPFLSLPGGVLLVLLLLTGLVAMLRSESIFLAMNGWLAIVSTMIVYALAALLFRTERSIQRVLDVLAFSFVIPAIFGLLQLAAGTYRVRGPFVSAPGFSMYLLLILIIFTGQFFVQSGMRKFLAAVIVATSGVLMIETFTRGAWAGALAALFVIAILRKRVLLVLALIAMVFALRMIPSVDTRLAEVETGISSLGDRLLLWQSTVQVWAAATDTGSSIATIVNRLVGLGPGSQPQLTAVGVYGEYNIAHNDYLRVAVDYGIFGLVVYLLLMLAVTAFAYRTWRRCTDKRLRAVAMSFIALTIGYAIFSLTDNIFGTTYIQIPLWTLAGLNVAIAKLQTQEEARRLTA